MSQSSGRQDASGPERTPDQEWAIEREVTQELLRSLLIERRKVYELTHEVRRLRRFEVAFTDHRRRRHKIHSFFTAISWAQSMEEVEEIVAEYTAFMAAEFDPEEGEHGEGQEQDERHPGDG